MFWHTQHGMSHSARNNWLDFKSKRGHSHLYCTIHCHMKHCFVWHCIKRTITLIVLHENILSWQPLIFHFVQWGCWISAVSVKTGYYTLCSRDLNEWQVDQVRSAPMVLLHVSHAQLYESIELKFTLGKLKGIWYEMTLVQNDGSTMHRFCIHCFFIIVTFTRSLIIDDKSIPHKLWRSFTWLPIFKI